MDRRDVLKLGAGFAAALYLARHADVVGEARADDGEPFSFATLIERARLLSLSPYAPPADTIPANYKDLNYDQYRDIRFKREEALWANDNLGFTAELFSAGYLYTTPIQIFTVAGGRATEIKYSPDFFAYGQNVTPPPEGTAPGFSGFRIHTPIDKANQMDEFAVFQGASYFRAKAPGQGYGLSARGLAIDTALPPHDEFPVFRAFWIVRPRAGAASVTVFALLDSESVSGAYKFVISARVNTVMDVDCTLFPRKSMTYAGIAPLTSMFYFAPSTSYQADEVRDRVHDSDGLAIWNGKGEHIWRPLINPPRVQFSAFVDNAIRGFGLVQRERRGDRYEDFEAHYEQRPSLWVEPRESFGQGSVDLVELPTTTEYFDNIVAFWHPKEPLAAGESYAYKYRLTWCDAPPLRINYATVAQTLVGASLQNAGRRLFNIDFAGTEEFKLCDDSVEFCGDKSRIMELTASAGTILNAIIRRNRVSGGHRVAFEYEPAEGSVEADLRCALVSDGKPISEVWIYRWTA